MRLAVLLIVLGNFSCSRIDYRNKIAGKSFISPKKNHARKVIVEGEKDFYLWGNLPSNYTVYVDREMRDVIGTGQMANIKITEYMSPYNFFISCITFGMYTPQNYRIEAYVAD